MYQQLELFVPDRFDMLLRRAPAQLDTIVVPVDDALQHVKTVHRDMLAAGRGAFLIVRGASGSGKSTFLRTLNLFLEDVDVFVISRSQPIEAALRAASDTNAAMRIIIIDERETLRQVPRGEIESSIHEINVFIRSQRGERTLVVWPSNADDLTDLLVTICGRVGDDALLGLDEPTYHFTGPPKEQYLDIATRTIATLNQGATLADLGISVPRATEIVLHAPTIGRFMGLLRREVLRNQRSVETLIAKEQFSLWIVVASGNDIEGDAAALTRGARWDVDIDALVNSTGANVVQRLKKVPDKLGILGSVLRAKILQLPPSVAMAVLNDFADDSLRREFHARSISLPYKNEGLQRLQDSELGRALAGVPRGTRSPGPRTAADELFRRITEIAQTNDALLNRALGNALLAARYISSFDTEQDVGSGANRKTDLLCTATAGRLRMELMWRSRTGRADIANYTLLKLSNYGHAIGFLE